jgi:hypothetical protein
VTTSSAVFGSITLIFASTLRLDSLVRAQPLLMDA